MHVSGVKFSYSYQRPPGSRVIEVHIKQLISGYQQKIYSCFLFMRWKRKRWICFFEKMLNAKRLGSNLQHVKFIVKFFPYFKLRINSIKN